MPDQYLEQKGADFTAGYNDVILSYLDSTRNVGSTVASDFVSALDNAKNSLSTLAAEFILFGEGGKDAVAQIARSLATELLSSLIKVGIQMGVNHLLASTLGTAAVATAQGQAAAASSAWTPAAIAASTATLGGAAGIGAAAYGAALASGAAANQAAMAAGFEEGGYTGDGRRNEIAGVVHRGEFVSDAGVTSRHRPFLEHLQQGGSPEDFARVRPVQAMAPMQQAAPAAASRSGTKVVIRNEWDRDGVRSELLDSEEADEIIVNRMARNAARIRNSLGIS